MACIAQMLIIILRYIRTSVPGSMVTFLTKERSHLLASEMEHMPTATVLRCSNGWDVGPKKILDPFSTRFRNATDRLSRDEMGRK